jgi:asparagine synthase (glutamine-hydrolysing)
MCGIAGFIGNRQIDPARIDRTLDLMGRRGPDHRDFAAFQHGDTHVYLLHSRLSIIDLDERSHQPYHYGPHVLLYNGELYNYVEIKDQLEDQAHTFVTTSDTEVLIKTLAHYGRHGLDKCEGMWAFALYNKEQGTLLLSRDRFGEKPLYLYRDETGLYFGSEIKFIAALLGRKLAVNYNHLYRYLVNGYKSICKGRETFFQGVEELPSATALEVSADGTESLHRYWEPKFQPDDSITYQQAVAGVREALIHAVKIRLRADVPLAFCMSGGVDSNSLISIAKRVFGYDVHGFTIANSDARYEEQEMVDCVVRELGLRHTSLPVDTSGFLPKLRTLTRQHDAPVSTITYYAHWLLMESIAAHGYKISISGSAADELFTGYYDHHLAYLYEVRNEAEVHARALAAWQEHILPIVRNPFLRNSNLFVEDPEFRDHIFLNADEFSEYLQQPWCEAFAEERFADGLLRNRMLNELFRETIPVILHEDDLNAMYYSIENTTPSRTGPRSWTGTSWSSPSRSPPAT